jgi:hypothetical protein
VLGALDEYDVAVTRAADALVADGLAGDLHCRSTTPGRVTGFGDSDTTSDATAGEDRHFGLVEREPGSR